MGNEPFLKSVGVLPLPFREAGLEAQQGRKRMLQLKSKSFMAKVAVYTGGKDLWFRCASFPGGLGYPV